MPRESRFFFFQELLSLLAQLLDNRNFASPCLLADMALDTLKRSRSGEAVEAGAPAENEEEE